MQKPLAAFTPHGRSSRNAFSLFLSVFLFHLNPLPFDHPPPSLFFVSPFLLSLFPSLLLLLSSFFSLYVARVCAGVQSFLSLSTHALNARPRIHTRCAVAELHAMLAHEKRSRGSISLDNRAGKRGINPPRVRPRDTIFVPRLFIPI